MQLPALGFNPQNALANFAPLNDAIDTYTQERSRKNALALQTRESDRQDEELSLRRQTTNQNLKTGALEYEAKMAQHYGGVAQMIEQQSDPVKRQQMWGQLVGSHPEWGNALKGAGVDPNDHVNGPKFVIAQARGYQDPMKAQKDRAELGHLSAQTDLVRAQTKAAGTKDMSNEYLMQLLTQPDQPQAQPQNGSIQPQSFQGGPSQPRLQQVADFQTPTQEPALNPGIMRVADQVPASDGEAATEPSGPANPGAVYAMPGNETVPTPFGMMSRDKARKVAAAAAMQGKGALSKMLMDAATGGGGQLSRAASTVNDKEEIAATNQLAAHDNIKKSYDPGFLKITNRFKMWGTALAEKFGQINPQDASELRRYSVWRQSSWQNLNRVLKDLSGTAVTENEMERQLRDQPNPGLGITDGDAPSAFEAKLQAKVAWAHSVVARARYLRSQGFTGKPWEAGIKVEDMPGIINNRGSEIEQQLRQNNPNADPMQLREAVKRQVKKEFGI